LTICQRVLALEVTADELFVDDGDLGGGGVLFAEVASGDAWDAEGGEVVRPGHVEIHVVFALRLGMAGDGEVVAAVAHGERDAIGAGGCDDAGECGDALACKA
jgi:hypothetical protein